MLPGTMPPMSRAVTGPAATPASRTEAAGLSPDAQVVAVPGRKYFFIMAALLALSAWSQTIPSAQAPPTAVGPQLTLSQVVEKLTQRNAARAKALESYHGKRVYQLDYQGFPKALHAEMAVEMTYTAPGRKQFKIVSESGSKLIVKRVLERLIEEETEAQSETRRLSVELNSRNYNFTSLEHQASADGCSYILGIEPIVASKFLYRGRIWVNEQDFAVCRIEAEPAKNPSVWITKTEIHHHYQKFGQFWLPVENQSVSSLRFGGRAFLTIRYQSYEITAGQGLKDNAASAGQ
jgi:hypothetical protein